MKDRPDTTGRTANPRRPALALALFLAVACALLSACNLPRSARDGATPADAFDDGAIMAAARRATGAARAPAAADAVVIKLGDRITVGGPGATVAGNVVRITAGGTYRLSGTLKDGQIIVDVKDERAVKLVFDGVDIRSASSAPLYVRRASTTVISLADGTENRLADGDSYDAAALEGDEPNAAIFSKDDLTFDGDGSLVVEGNYRYGIASKDELTIRGGNIFVRAASDGIRGRDSVVMKGGNVSVDAGADGLQANNDEDPAKGFVSIEGGTLGITAALDGIQAETRVAIREGTITVSSGGGSAVGSADGGEPGSGDTPNQPADGAPSPSQKGIKAGSDVEVDGGTITVDAADDALHANHSIAIDDGKITLASGDDGIHADSSLTINGGDIRVTRSFEAMESAVVAINGGTIHLAATDDGVSVAGDDDRAASDRREGADSANAARGKHLQIEGGYVAIDATGDGLDINGWVKMTGGTVIINGPVVNFNGALDYDREFTMAGGTLVAVGSSGMAQAPDATSTQNSLAVTLASSQPAGTLVHIEAADGARMLTFAPLREYQSVVYSSPKLEKGSTYNIYIGGSATGKVADGVYSGGEYTPDARGIKISRKI